MEKIKSSVKVKNHFGEWKKGKGFSKREILSVWLNIEDAVRIGIPYDKRRKSYHQRNVEFLLRI